MRAPRRRQREDRSCRTASSIGLGQGGRLRGHAVHARSLEATRARVERRSEQHHRLPLETTVFLAPDLRRHAGSPGLRSPLTRAATAFMRASGSGRGGGLAPLPGTQRSRAIQKASCVVRWFHEKLRHLLAEWASTISSRDRLPLRLAVGIASCWSIVLATRKGTNPRRKRSSCSGSTRSIGAVSRPKGRSYEPAQWSLGVAVRPSPFRRCSSTKPSRPSPSGCACSTAAA